jgi:hypothetical protein
MLKSPEMFIIKESQSNLLRLPRNGTLWRLSEASRQGIRFSCGSKKQIWSCFCKCPYFGGIESMESKLAMSISGDFKVRQFAVLINVVPEITSTFSTIGIGEKLCRKQCVRSASKQ